MERYHIYKLGIAILFYAVYCRRPMLVNGLEVDDVVGSVNNKSSNYNDYPYVYYQGVQGIPGVDFPVFARIPRTKFSCRQVESGYYADLETDCQVFHICNEGTKVSFLCPNGTIFQQQDLICDWWFKVNCTNSPNLYEESAEQLRESYIRRKASRRVLNGNVKFADRKMDDFSEESQIPQESASFFKSKYNNIDNSKKRYPNHRDTYGEIKNPTSLSPKLSNKNALNNGQPFVISTPTFGVYSTEKSTFYSPTVPTTQKPLRGRKTNQRNYNNLETFTNPPSVANGKSTTLRKPKSKSITIGLNTVQGPITIKQKTTTPFPETTTLYESKITKFENNFGNFVNSPNQNNNYGNKINKQTTNNSSHEINQQNKFKVTTNNNIQNFETTTSNYNNFNSKTNFENNYSTTNYATEKQTIFSNIFNGPTSVTESSFSTGFGNTIHTLDNEKLTQKFNLDFKPTTSTKISTETNASRNPKSFDATKTNNIKINLSSDQGFKPIQPNVIRLNLSNGQAKPITNFENEIPTNRPSTGFYVTKQNTLRPAEFATSRFNAGSITGSKNTYIPTTTDFITSDFNAGSITGSKNTYIPTTASPIYTTTEYHSNTFGFVKPTGVPKPKPFELVSTVAPIQAPLSDLINPTLLPNYQISSASPFTNQPPTLPSSYTTIKPAESTLPTIYTSARAFTNTPMPDNIHGMIDTLREIANVRVAKEEQFESARPGLVVPPSVGPQTLHTLAVYFANALDGLSDNSTETQTEVSTQANENLVINSLLSRHTVDKYHELFKEPSEEIQGEEAEEKEEDNDLDVEHSNNAVQSPRVRQLAKVFTQALSSYLDDPEMFRKVLQQIRPTAPPPIPTLEGPSTEEEELLNFSDADIKPENPRLPTPPPANPTWGYILAFNNSNQIDNNNLENLQSADSQSFIPHYNEFAANRINKELKDKKNLPFNHWTSSPEVAKLWQTTLYVNPVSINENFDATDSPPSSKETSEDFEDDSTTAPSLDSAEFADYVTEAQIDYQLRSLPKFELNSTQVHGILIDFMNSTKHEEGSKLQRILQKLNTTEGEFLDKMKEIEKNPLTRRLILLLISECGNKDDTVKDIISLGSTDDIQIAGSDLVRVQDKKPNGFIKLVEPKLKEDDQDSRALQLLNSLYSIASKYGK